MRILVATSEAVPYIKTGGLADVTGALLREFRKKNEKAFLILPLYSAIKNNFKLYRTGKSFSITLGDITLEAVIWASGKSPNHESYFIECDALYGRAELYGTAEGNYPDNALRFIFFSRAVLETCSVMNLSPDIIHCNDWHTALIPLYLKTLYRNNKFLKDTAVIFTIHNLGYQGIFDASDMKYTGLGPDFFTPEGLEFYGRLNIMKAGLLYADVINTVSITYAREILQKENGFGLDGLLRKRRNDLHGILNGLYSDEWSPVVDGCIPGYYDPDDIKGKAKCKKVLLQDAKLDDKKLPLLGVVSRLSSQKGLDLIYNSLEELVSMRANIIMLGKGDIYYQKLFSVAAKKYRGKISVEIGFEESLARRIYAGSDFFLMPSRYEPCGLGQLIAMKYGTIPIARKTGGLADTIQDYNHILMEGRGFLFSDYTPAAMQNAVKRALCVFTDRKRMKKLIRDAMTSDFSWKTSAEKYIELYKKAISKVKE